VTRGLWGDLVRDLRDEDADLAEAMSQSVIRRTIRAQSPMLRALRLTSRVSLREPYADDIPNRWPARTPIERLRLNRLRRLRALLPGGRRRRTVPGAATAVALVVVLALLAAGCAEQLDFTTAPPPQTIDTPPVPDELAGLKLVREPSADAAYATLAKQSIVVNGRVWSVRQGEALQASLQVAWFKPGLADRSTEVRRKVLKHLENGSFQLRRFNDERIYVQKLPEQTLYLWYPPDVSYYVLIVARLGFDAGPLFVALLAYQRGEQPDDGQAGQQVAVPDPFRGAP
jgi:hypothetical protein